MGRVAVFVDAGHFYARCGELVYGRSVPRRDLDVDETALIDALVNLANERTKAVDTLLRIYWYDGAPSTGLSAEQLRLADLDDVKMRLGVINTFGQQKGVDSLIIMDLIDLARNHAIDSAVLLSGDEDLRVAVTVAQTYGVRVHLLGIGGPEKTAQSRSLVHEVDTTAVWDLAYIKSFLKEREQRLVTVSLPMRSTQREVAVASPPRSDEGEVSMPGTAAYQETPLALARRTDDLNAPDPADDSDEALQRIRAATATFVGTLSTADRDDILLTFNRQGTLPIAHDRRLLGSVGRTFARRLTAQERNLMRLEAVELLRSSVPIDK